MSQSSSGTWTGTFTPGVCSKCGKPFLGINNTDVCKCWDIGAAGITWPPPEPEPEKGLMGWICPNCGTGVSPFQPICPVCNKNEITVTYTIT